MTLWIRYSKLGVDCYFGNAKITSPHEVEINGTKLTTRSIIVATGAEPLVPPIPGLEKIDYLTSENLWELKQLPKRMLVLGGGPIGSEISQTFSRLGSTVTQVEMAPQILTREDEDVIKLVTNQFIKEGINVLTNHKAIRFNKNNLICSNDEKEVSLPFDKVVIALGRKARISGFGLEELNIEIRKQKQLKQILFTN